MAEEARFDQKHIAEESLTSAVSSCGRGAESITAIEGMTFSLRRSSSNKLQAGSSRRVLLIIHD